MTAEEYIKKFNAKPSTKYPDRYDVDGHVHLSFKNLTELPIPFGVVTGNFFCSNNRLTTLIGAPIEVGWDFWCSNNQLTTLDHLPKHIAGRLYCHDNPFQNLNALKDLEIEDYIDFYHITENELDYWIKALYNTDLNALEYHYDNHKYDFEDTTKLKNYVMNELEEIIKIKRIKKDLLSYISNIT